jgi:integron integrase
MSASASPAAKPRFLDLVRDRILLKGQSPRTVAAYVSWIRRYIVFHGKRHPADLGETHVVQFLTHLVTVRNVSASTQNQALAALLFLYREVLGVSLAKFSIPRSRRPKRLPTVLSEDEVTRLLGQLSGTLRLIAELLYGAGLRLEECLALRVHNVDADASRLHVIDGKGRKERYTLLPRSLKDALDEHLQKLSALHGEDILRGFGAAVLPSAYARKSRSAVTDFRWQYLFPGNRPFTDPHTGFRGRWHLDPSVVQRAIRAASLSASITKRVGPHTLRHTFATHLLQHGCDIRRIQVLLGHSNIKTTMVYLHLLDGRRQEEVVSPLDRIRERRAAPGTT